MLFDTFSKRKKREMGVFSDVYQYEEIPTAFRVQIVQMLQEAFSSDGEYFHKHAISVIKFINKTLCREYGVFNLAGKHEEGFQELSSFILNEKDYEKVLDAIELSFKYIENVIRENKNFINSQISVDDLIIELNQRFKEAGIGYQYESGEVLRVDCQLLHSEVVKPVLQILRENIYSPVNQEFLAAHEHYRHGKYEEACSEANKSLESLLKIVCTHKEWDFGSTDTSRKLITVVLNNGLLPDFMQNQLNVMQNLLESGVPTVRNKMAGHGQGAEIREMPEYIASYVIHLTATTILLIASAAALH
jgi:HEPN domain-containing protein